MQTRRLLLLAVAWCGAYASGLSLRADEPVPPPVFASKCSEVTPGSFVNPIAEGADPWVVRHDGRYLLCASEGNRGIALYESQRLTEVGPKRVVWTAPPTGPYSDEIWAPELHQLDGAGTSTSLHPMARTKITVLMYWSQRRMIHLVRTRFADQSTLAMTWWAARTIAGRSTPRCSKLTVRGISSGLAGKTNRMCNTSTLREWSRLGKRRRRVSASAATTIIFGSAWMKIFKAAG